MEDVRERKRGNNGINIKKSGKVNLPIICCKAKSLQVFER